MRFAGAGSITMMILFNGNEELQWHPIWRQPRRPMNFLGKVTFIFFLFSAVPAHGHVPPMMPRGYGEINDATHRPNEGRHARALDCR
jgi:hypothetical protein